MIKKLLQFICVLTVGFIYSTNSFAAGDQQGGKVYDKYRKSLSDVKYNITARTSTVHDFGDATSLEIPNKADVSGNTGEGLISWDSDNDKLYVGNGAAVVEIAAGGSPEGTAVLSTGEAGGTKFLREDGDGTCSWQATAGGSPEGTAVLSTGEVGGTKFLREDGDGTCSWQAAGAGATAYDDIADPDAAGSIAFDDTETASYITSQDTAGSFFMIHNTLADVSNQVHLLQLTYDDDADADADFLICRDDLDGTPATVFEVEFDGDTTSAKDITAGGSFIIGFSRFE